MNCFALEYGDKSLQDILFQLSDQWMLFDPFGNYWCPENESNSDVLYKLGHDSAILSNDFDWINTVVIFDARSVDLAKVSGAPRLELDAKPDWGLRYDYFLLNFELFSSAADFCVFPGLWYPDAPGGNLVALCREINSIRNLTVDLVTPIAPESVLRTWRTNMLDYITSGIGLTGQRLRSPG